MSQTATTTEGPLVLVGAQNGIALIPASTPLTRLNYFDGKFLRAEDLNTEQKYLRSLVQMSNQAGGSGVVHGFTTKLGPDGTLDLSAGLAIDPSGRALFLPQGKSLSIPELIQESREQATTSGAATPAAGANAFAPCETAAVQPPSATTTFPTDLYLIALVHAEALCGEEDVYGKLCEDACVTSTDRPFRIEGTLVRALPLTLCPPTCGADWLTSLHRRSQVASAYFATERELHGKRMNGTRLMLDLWCNGAEAAGGSVVPLAIVSMSGDTVDFLDAWSARRERMESPPRRYWSWQMMMRPWNVYIAQVLQFQCHLHKVLTGLDTPPGDGHPCEDQSEALRQAVSLLEEIETYTANREVAGASSEDSFRPDFLTRVADLKSNWNGVLENAKAPSGTRILITAGIVELPPAGYLPVTTGNVDVNTQVRRLLGDGVDLRFCTVRPDYVAHALEEAQHLERICLLQGIENPADAQEVDILVPDGITTSKPAPAGRYFETDVGIVIPAVSLPGPTADENGDAREFDENGNPQSLDGTVKTAKLGPQFRGAGRSEILGTGGAAFHFAGLMVQSVEQLVGGIRQEYEKTPLNRREGLADSGATRKTPFSFNINEMMSRFTANFANMGSAGPDSMMRKTIGLKYQAAAPPAPAVWATMRSERNPFALEIGASTEIRLEAAVGASYGDYLFGGRLHLQGHLYCDQMNPSASARRVKGRAHGFVWLSGRAQSGSQVISNQAPPKPIRVHAEMELQPNTGEGGSLVITVTTEKGFEFSITTDWKGGPTIASLSVTVDLIDTLAAIIEQNSNATPEQREQADAYLQQLEEENPELRAIEIGRAKLNENAEVANDANPHHAIAIKSIRTIEQALDEDGFRASAEQLLFPSPPPQTEEKRILPTRDWVLFHRRRTSSCDCCPPEKRTSAPPRRFQVYEITAPRPLEVEHLRRVLAAGAELEMHADAVGVIEFEGGTARISGDTSAEQIREGWRAAEPGTSIIYGAISAVGAAMNDPEALAEQRVGRVADLVRGITPLDPTTDFDLLPFVPDGLSAQGVDGVILFVTVPEQQVSTQTHRVIAMNHQGAIDTVVSAIQQNNLTQVLSRYALLGEVDFSEGTAEVADDSLEPIVQTWQERFPARLASNYLVVLPESTSMPIQIAESQRDVIGAALEAFEPHQTMNTAENVFAGADAITLLEVRQIIID